MQHPGKVNYFVDARLEDLPTELVVSLSNDYLDDRSVVSWSAASKHFNLLFKSPTCWFNRIINEFQVRSEDISQIIKLTKNVNYIEWYKKLKRLSQCISHASNEIKFFYADNDNNTNILMCCVDDPESFLTIIDPVEIYLWLEVALLAGCLEIPKYIYDKALISHLKYLESNLTLSKKDQENAIKVLECANEQVVKTTTSANRLDMIKYLLNQTGQFGLEVNAKHLVFAAEYGRDDMIDFYFNSNSNLKSAIVEPVTTLWNENVLIINVAAEGGHLNTIQKLIRYGAVPDQTTFNLTKKANNSPAFTPSMNNKLDVAWDIALINAARSCNLGLVRHLLLLNCTNLDVDLTDFKESKCFAITNIIFADLFFRTVLAGLSQGVVNDEVNMLLTFALTISLIKTAESLLDVLKNPEFYQLPQSAVNYLYDFSMVIVKDGYQSVLNKQPEFAIYFRFGYMNEVFFENWKKNFSREMDGISVTNKCRM